MTVTTIEVAKMDVDFSDMSTEISLSAKPSLKPTSSEIPLSKPARQFTSARTIKIEWDF